MPGSPNLPIKTVAFMPQHLSRFDDVYEELSNLIDPSPQVPARKVRRVGLDPPVIEYGDADAQKVGLDPPYIGVDSVGWPLRTHSLSPPFILRTLR